MANNYEFDEFIKDEIEQIARDLNVDVIQCRNLSNESIIKWIEKNAEEFRRKWIEGNA